MLRVPCRYVSKATGQPLAKIAARCMAGQKLNTQSRLMARPLAKWCLRPSPSKEAVFPFNKFPGVDPVLGLKCVRPAKDGCGRHLRRSHAEVSAGRWFASANQGHRVHLCQDGDKARAVAVARDLIALAWRRWPPKGTAAAIAAAGVAVKPVNQGEGRPSAHF